MQRLKDPDTWAARSWLRSGGRRGETRLYGCASRGLCRGIAGRGRHRLFLFGHLFLCRGVAGHGELERGAMIGFRLDPDLSAPVLDDLFADGQTDAVAGEF